MREEHRGALPAYEWQARLLLRLLSLGSTSQFLRLTSLGARTPTSPGRPTSSAQFGRAGWPTWSGTETARRTEAKSQPQNGAGPVAGGRWEGESTWPKMLVAAVAEVLCGWTPMSSSAFSADARRTTPSTHRRRTCAEVSPDSRAKSRGSRARSSSCKPPHCHAPRSLHQCERAAPYRPIATTQATACVDFDRGITRQPNLRDSQKKNALAEGVLVEGARFELA